MSLKTHPNPSPERFQDCHCNLLHSHEHALEETLKNFCSPVASVRQCPRSRRNERASGPSTSDAYVSTATGSWHPNVCHLGLLCPLCYGTRGHCSLGRCEGVNVSGHAASQTMTLPCLQGTNEMLSGCFPPKR